MGWKILINLGWKLAAVLEGWGGEALLAFILRRTPSGVSRDVAEDFIAKTRRPRRRVSRQA